MPAGKFCFSSVIVRMIRSDASSALDFLPAVKDWMAAAATRPGISGRGHGARRNEVGPWPTAVLDFLPAVKDWMAAAATRPGISGRGHGARRNEVGPWPTAVLELLPAGNGRRAAAATPHG